MAVAKHIAAVLLVLGTPAFALEPDIEIGWRRYGIVGDGTWYQEAFPHKLDISGPVWSIGIRHQWRKNYYWRLAWVDLGSIRSDALAMTSDEEYETTYKNGAATECWRTNTCTQPLARWIGSGRVYGIYASILRRPSSGFMWELGLGLYKPQWRMDIYGPAGNYTDGPSDDWELHLVHVPHWQLGPKFGIGYGWSNGWELQLTSYWVRTNGLRFDSGGTTVPSLYDYGHSNNHAGTLTLTVRKSL